MTVIARSHSLVVVCTLHGPVYDYFAGFHDFAADDHFVENLVDFIKVENEIELANASEILIEHLHKQVDEFKHGKFIVVSVNA